MGLAERVIVDSLREGRPTRWVVRGASMWPTIRDGASVLVTPCDPRAVRVGDVIAYSRGGALVVHRVASLGADGVACRGDALSRDDAAIPWSDVLGRASVVEQRPLSLRWPRPRELRALARATLAVLRGVLA